MRGAAILDFEVGVVEILQTFRVGYPNSGAVPVAMSHWELGKSDFRVQIGTQPNTGPRESSGLVSVPLWLQRH